MDTELVEDLQFQILLIAIEPIITSRSGTCAPANGDNWGYRTETDDKIKKNYQQEN